MLEIAEVLERNEMLKVLGVWDVLVVLNVEVATTAFVVETLRLVELGTAGGRGETVMVMVTVVSFG